PLPGERPDDGDVQGRRDGPGDGPARHQHRLGDLHDVVPAPGAPLRHGALQRRREHRAEYVGSAGRSDPSRQPDHAGGTARGAGQLTGNVTFYDGGTALGSAALSNGVAKLTQVKLGPGNHNLTAAYQATSSFAGSRSATMHFAVASTTVTTLQVPTLVLGQ